MQAEQGTLIPATLSPVGQGITDAQFAIVNIGGLSQRCVVKHVGDREIAAECFCALLGHHLSLPVLVPVVVTDPRNNGLWFGARDVGYPSLSSRLTASPTTGQLAVLTAILATWAHAPAVISFAELIANGDRNPGNVLWNGATFTIIDHERALGIQPMTINKLAYFTLLNASAAHVAAIQSGTTSAALAQQSLLGVNSSIWGAIQSEFDNLPAVISRWFSPMVNFAKNRVTSLVGNATNATTPLFT